MNIEIEKCHEQALRNNSKFYKHPETGSTIYTEIAHLKRGKCCGYKCPHCPYGWYNVPNKAGFVDSEEFRKEQRSRKVLVQSGDKERALKVLEEIQLKYQGHE